MYLDWCIKVPIIGCVSVCFSCHTVLYTGGCCDIWCIYVHFNTSLTICMYHEVLELKIDPAFITQLMIVIIIHISLLGLCPNRVYMINASLLP